MLAEKIIYKNEILETEFSKNKNFEEKSAKIYFFPGVFRRHHVLQDPINFIDPTGLSWLEFHRSSGTLLLYPGTEGTTAGPPQAFAAANNASSTSGGSWPDGQYDYEKYNPHAGADSDSAYGLNGNFMFGVPGRTDMGVHSGRANKCDKANRCGVDYATLGCIRTTDEATSKIKRMHNGGDRLTHLKVR